MDPVGQADADINNDGKVNSTDNYLGNRRKAISKARKGKGKVGEKAVMHGGQSSSEKKNRETMAVGEMRAKPSGRPGSDYYQKLPRAKPSKRPASDYKKSVRN